MHRSVREKSMVTAIISSDVAATFSTLALVYNCQYEQSQGARLRCVWHGGRLAQHDPPRRPGAWQDEGSGCRLGAVRRFLASRLRAGHGPRSQRGAALDIARPAPSNDTGPTAGEVRDP